MCSVICTKAGLNPGVELGPGVGLAVCNGVGVGPGVEVGGGPPFPPGGPKEGGKDAFACEHAAKNAQSKLERIVRRTL